MPDDPDEKACTIEGQVVRIADIMAYLNHDLDDAIRSGVISSNQIPETCSKLLGRSHSERATTMIRDLIFSTKASGDTLCLEMSGEIYDAMTKLREFLYDNVYRSPEVHNEFVKAKKILSDLYSYFVKDEKVFHRELVNMEMAAIYRKKNLGEETYERIVCDFIASITDRYALDLYSKIFFPSPLV